MSILKLFFDTFVIFSSPEHEMLRVSYCDHSPSIVRPSVVHLSIVRSHFLVYTLASTNINQSALDLVQKYMTIRSQMSSIVGQIRPELSELFALELENLPYLTLASANIDRSVPNLATIYMSKGSRMRSIMGQIEPEHLELFALKFEKIAEYFFNLHSIIYKC